MEPIDYKGITVRELMEIRKEEFENRFTRGSFSTRSYLAFLDAERDLSIWECWMLGLFKPELMDPDFPDKPFFQCYTEDQLRFLYDKRMIENPLIRPTIFDKSVAIERLKSAFPPISKSRLLGGDWIYDDEKSEAEEPSELNFRDELRSLINRHSMENGSNTPDFILADFLQGCLELFDKSILSREGYFGTKRATW